MHKALFASVGLALLISCGPSESTQEPVAIPFTEGLVYLGNKGGSFNLYRNSLAGDLEMQLTEAPGWEWMPQFVAEGKYLVYNSQDTSGTFRQLAMGLVGQPKAFDAQGLEGVYVAPTGDWAAYTRPDGEETNFLRIAPLANIADSMTLGFPEAYNGRPKWSHDGLRLLFLSDESGSNELYVYDRRNQETRRLTHNDLREKYATWSWINEAVLTTVADSLDQHDVYEIDLSTGKMERLAQTKVSEQEIAWSPSGRFLAYHGTLDSTDHIYLWELATDSVWQITQGDDHYYGEPEWILLPKQP